MIHLCWVFQHAFFRRCLLVCCTRVAVCAILRVDMKHNTPQLQYSLAPISRRCFRRPPKRKPTLNSSCLKTTLTEGDFRADVSKRRFTGCRISGIALERAAFIDCVLEHCDCSNVNLQKASLERTRLSDCKLVGATLEAFLLDVSLIDCIARYSNFSSSKIRHTLYRLRPVARGAWRLQAGKDRIRTLPAHRRSCFKHRLPAWISRLRHFRHRDQRRGAAKMRA